MEMKINVELLKKFRNEKAWSQDQLADISGLSLRTIQQTTPCRPTIKK